MGPRPLRCLALAAAAAGLGAELSAAQVSLRPTSDPAWYEGLQFEVVWEATPNRRFVFWPHEIATLDERVEFVRRDRVGKLVAGERGRIATRATAFDGEVAIAVSIESRADGLRVRYQLENRDGERRLGSERSRESPRCDPRRARRARLAAPAAVARTWRSRGGSGGASCSRSPSRIHPVRSVSRSGRAERATSPSMP